jgi:hypothetical protein
MGKTLGRGFAGLGVTGLLVAMACMPTPTHAAATKSSMTVSATVVSGCTIALRPAGAGRLLRTTMAPFMALCPRGVPYSVQTHSDAAQGSDNPATTVTTTIIF